MKIRSTFLFFLASFSFLSAQVLEEKAQFSDTKRGTAVFELNAGEHIYTFEPDDGWYKV